MNTEELDTSILKEFVGVPVAIQLRINYLPMRPFCKVGMSLNQITPIKTKIPYADSPDLPQYVPMPVNFMQTAEGAREVGEPAVTPFLTGAIIKNVARDGTLIVQVSNPPAVMEIFIGIADIAAITRVVSIEEPNRIVSPIIATP